MATKTRKAALLLLMVILLFLPVAGPVPPTLSAVAAGPSIDASPAPLPGAGTPLRTPPIYGVAEGESFDRPDVFRTVIVGLRKGEPLDESLVTARGGEVRRTFPFINSYSARLPETAIPRLAGLRAVEFVDVDVDLPVFFGTAQTPDWGISHVNADEHHSIGNRGAGIRVAVLDTGIDLNHPDLDGNLDPANPGWDYVNNDAVPDDDHGHGTSVAAVIAAEDNSGGVLGSAPTATLYAVKVLDAAFEGTPENVVQGIQWAWENGMDIINMSLRTYVFYASMKAATDAAYYDHGILVVAAVGNEGYQLPVAYPAKFDSVIAVGAIDSNNTIADFSNRGSEVELVAPGVNIRSAWINGYRTGLEGTSYSTPYVSGVAALVMSSPIDPHFDLDGDSAWDAAEVRSRLAATADDLGSGGRDFFFGYGVLDARRFDASVSGGFGLWQSSVRLVDGRLEAYAFSSWEPDWSSAHAFARSTFTAQADFASPEFVYTLYERGSLWAADEWSTATSYGRIKLLNSSGNTLFDYQPVLHSLEGPGQLNIDETHRLSYAWNGTLTAGQAYTIEVGLKVETLWDAEADFSSLSGGTEYAAVVWSPVPYLTYSDGFDRFFDNMANSSAAVNWRNTAADPPNPATWAYVSAPPSYYVEGSGPRSEYIANAEYAKDVVLEAYVRLTPGTDPFAGVVARWQRSERDPGGPQYMAVWLHKQGGGSGGVRLEQWRPVSGWTQYEDVGHPLNTTDFYKMRVELRDQHVRVLVDDQLKIDGTYGIDNVPGLSGLTVATTPGQFDSFWSSGLDTWSFLSGSWGLDSGQYDPFGQLHQEQAADNRRAMLEGLDLTDFTYSATVNLKVKDNWGTGLTFRTDASGYGYVLCFRTSTIELWKERGLGQGQKAVYSFSAAENTNYTLKVRATGNKFTFYRNGVLLGTWTDPYNDLAHGYLGFDAANHAHFDDVKVTVG